MLKFSIHSNQWMHLPFRYTVSISVKCYFWHVEQDTNAQIIQNLKHRISKDTYADKSMNSNIIRMFLKGRRLAVGMQVLGNSISQVWEFLTVYLTKRQIALLILNIAHLFTLFMSKVYIEHIWDLLKNRFKKLPVLSNPVSLKRNVTSDALGILR